MLPIFLGLLTLALIFAIFLAAFLRLWKTPPSISIEVKLPEALTVQLQHVPAKLETDKPTVEPIPEHILEYISFESEQHAQDARKRRVRWLKEETGSWDVAFRMLQKEDNPE